MFSCEAIVALVETNYAVIKRQVEGLTHEDSLLQLPFRGNCLNWTIGHIMVSRDSMFKAMGEELMWPQEERRKRYGFDSEPITEDGDDVVDFDQMIADLDASQPRLIEALSKLTAEQLEAPRAPGKASLGQFLHFLGWHEGYHTGQTELLRQLSGTDDKII